MWQVTACYAASSFGTAALLPELFSKATAAFLEEIHVPLYREAGWPIRRVLVDGDSEFKGHFRGTCRRLGIWHKTTKPRHAWTNGFVERLHGTILHEHWPSPSDNATSPAEASLERSPEAFITSDPIWDTGRPAGRPPKCSLDSRPPSEDESANTITGQNTLGLDLD